MYFSSAMTLDTTAPAKAAAKHSTYGKRITMTVYFTF